MIAVLTVLTSAAKNQSKLKIFEKLDNHRKSTNSLTNKVAEVHFRETKLVASFFIVTLLCFFCCILNAFLFVPFMVQFYVEYQIFFITINVQSLQILLFASRIEHALHDLSKVEINGFNEPRRDP